MLLKYDATEMIYNIRKYINERIFGKGVSNSKIEENITEAIMYRGWTNKSIRKHIALCMM